MCTLYILKSYHGLIQRGGKGVRTPPSPPHTHGKSQVVKGFLRNSETDPPSRSNWTPWVQLFLEEGTYMYGPLCNTLMTKSNFVKTTHPHPPHPDGIFWIRPMEHGRKLLLCLSSFSSHKHEKRYVYTLYFSKQTDFRKTVTYTANGT